MKKFIKITFLLLVVILVGFVKVSAFTPLDEILEYHIYVDPTEEGNLNMRYHIKWRVLDDDSEGPLEWVKIGVPNRYVSNIEAISGIIDDAYYYSDDGAYIRLDLTKKVYENETIDLDFSFTQTHIYNLNGDYVEYSFMPGWFDEIKVKELKVFWNKAKIDYCDTAKEDNGYYLWEETNLNYNETIKTNVRYHKNSFIYLSEDNQYSDKYMSKTDIIIICVIVGIFVGIIVYLIVYNYIKNDGYESYRGFAGTRYHRRWWWHHYYGVNSKGNEIKPPVVRSTGGGHSGGSSCACACACACAGGGRAGCSRKDYYNPNVEVDTIIKKVEE